MTSQTEFVTFEIDRYRDADLDEILALCLGEGWPSLPADADRAKRALTAPGVTSVVARSEGHVIGFAQMLSDGEIQAYLATMVVHPDRRGQGIGRRLIEAAVARAGAERVDLLAEEDATGFYRRLPHRTRPGFRLYPPLDEPLSPEEPLPPKE